MASTDSIRLSRQVLIVEDDPVFQRSIGEAVLQLETGWLVHCVRTGSEALAFCNDSASRLDLALVDLGLPDIGGIEIIQAIRSRFPDTPIMVVPVLSSAALCSMPSAQGRLAIS